jgi:Rps23 Pro-64 3,4-dihydroxylase Tpa1-like proline 4-hydroxylase
MNNLKISKNEYYSKNKPFPYLVQDNILEETFAKNIQKEILEIEEDKWDRYDNPFEGKYTLRSKDHMPENCGKLFDYLNSNKFIKELSEIVGINLFPDPTKNFWGIHKYKDGDHLDIHSDAGRHPKTHQKKQVTLGIYLSKDWKEENKGHLELWKGENCSNDNAKILECKERVLPSFNKLIVFNCDDFAWHGNPDPVICKNNEKRIFLTMSYLSEEQDNYDNKRVKAFFVPRPDDKYDEKKDKLRFLRADPEKYKEIYRT